MHRTNERRAWQAQTAQQDFPLHKLCVPCCPDLPPLGIRSQPEAIKEHYRVASLVPLCLGLAWIQASTHRSKLLELGSENEKRFYLLCNFLSIPSGLHHEVVPTSSPEAGIQHAVGCSVPPLQGAWLVLNSQLLPFISLSQDQYLDILHETFLLLWHEISTFWLRCLPCF